LLLYISISAAPFASFSKLPNSSTVFTGLARQFVVDSMLIRIPFNIQAL
jgi:hypothetical protein